MLRITVIWLLLIGSTAITAFIGESPEVWGGHVVAAAIAVLLIAMIKVHFVIYEFMEVRLAPAVLKIIGAGWAMLAFLSMTSFYLLPVFNVKA